VDLSERGEHFGAAVAGHGDDRGDVLDDENASVADAAQQPAVGVLGLLPFGGAGQERGLACDGGLDDGAGADARLHGLGRGCAGPGDDQQPQWISAESFGCERSQDDVEDVEVVLVTEPAAEHPVALVEQVGAAGGDRVGVVAAVVQHLRHRSHRAHARAVVQRLAGRHVERAAGMAGRGDRFGEYALVGVAATARASGQARHVRRVPATV
jgi:hypothetical protein